MSRKKILILSRSYTASDPRILRQVRSLHQDFEITVVGLEKCNGKGISYDLPIFQDNGFFRQTFLRKIILATSPLAGWLGPAFWDSNNRKVFKELKHTEYDVIIANELNTLPLAFALKDHSTKPSFVWCDLHEYYLDDATGSNMKSKWRRRYNRLICNKFLHKVDWITNVTRSIGDLYEHEFGIKSDVITNACRHYAQRPTNVDPNRIRLVHHGACMKKRTLDQMIEMMDFLDDRFELNLYLVNRDPKYYGKLVELAKGKKINFHQPVAFNEIVTTTNQYDIGVFLLPPINTNYKLALPNKFFEFLQARLGIAIGPSTEMKQIVIEHGLGVVSSEFSPQTLATELNKLTVNQIKQFKLNSDSIAMDFSSDENERKIRNKVVQLLNRKPEIGLGQNHSG